MPKERIELRFCGGMDTLHTGLDLGVRKRGETQSMTNADLTLLGRVKRLLPLTALNTSPATDIKSVFVANGVVFVQDGSDLKYLNGTTLTTLKAALSSGKFRFDNAGDWLFVGTGDAKKSVYIPGPTVCDWGVDVPTTAPTVAAGSSGSPDGTYSCYYRYKITLPDGTIIRTALSPVASVIVTSDKIEWSGIVHSTFEGATTIQAELFRTTSSFAETYLVTTLTSGTTTYSDDLSDATLQLQTAYDETGYYPPPPDPSIVYYYENADRMLCTVGGDAYWSEPGLYHIFIYNATAAEYTNVNGVFLSGEDITAIKKIDENPYFGSQRTWRRLRGRDPVSWSWESTAAKKGPLSNEGAVETPFGVPYPGNDSRMWLFNGFESRPILESYVFPTQPDANSHSTYDGRFYRLNTSDPTHPEVVVDFLQYPSSPPRLVQSTRSSTASFFDNLYGKLYLTDAQYVRQGEAGAQSVAISFRTAEVLPEDVATLGKMGMLVVSVNTKGDSLIITPVADGVAQVALKTVITSNLARKEVALPLKDCYALAFDIAITSASAIVLEEPILIRRE